MRDRRAAIEAIGSDSIYKSSYESSASPEEIRKRIELEKQLKKEKKKKKKKRCYLKKVPGLLIPNPHPKEIYVRQYLQNIQIAFVTV
ncbi:hypothetical protein [Rheinheimera sp.]|uniref:hypothetical protein n=1 Tax=Rheinheimera sp. TaxID=1869214 RepID=UPI003D2DAD2B